MQTAPPTPTNDPPRTEATVADEQAREGWVGPTIATIAVLGLIVVPLWKPGTYDSAASWTFAAAGVLAPLALAAARPRRLPRSVAFGVAALIALSLYYVVASSWALLPAGAVVEGARIMSFALAAIAGYCAAGRAGARAGILLAIVAVAAVIAADVALPVLVDGVPAERQNGILGYWNATALCGSIVGLAGLAFLASDRWWLRLAGVPLGALTGLCLVATASRGAIVALVVGAIWLFIVVAGYRTRGAVASVVVALTLVGGVLAGEGSVAWVAGAIALGAVLALAIPTLARRIGGGLAHRGIRRVAIGVAVAAALVVLAAGALRLPTAIEDFTHGPIPDQPSAARLVSVNASSRWVWWKEAAGQWAKRPLQGWGGQAFAVRRGADPATLTFVQRPHNMLLQLGIEGGIVAVLLGAFAGVLLLASMWHARSIDGVPLAGAIAVGAGAQALADWTLSVPFVAIVVAVCVGLASRPVAGAGESARSLRVEPVIAFAVAVVCALPVLLPGAAFALYDRAQTELVAGKPRRAIAMSGVSWALLPTSQALLTKVTAYEVHGDRADAQRALSAGIPQVRNDRTPWPAIADLARVWGDDRLEIYATQRTVALDPRTS